MLDVKAVAANPESFEARLRRRNEDAGASLAPAKAIIAERRELNVTLEGLKKRQADANAQIRTLMQTDKLAGEKARVELRAMGEELKKKEERLTEVEAELAKLLLVVPNPPHESVPDG